MAQASTSNRCSSMGAALALVLCVLVQASVSSATKIEFEASITTPIVPIDAPTPFSFPHHGQIPTIPLPRKFLLPPLPSKVGGFAIPPVKPLEGLHLPTIPPTSFTIPKFPGFKVPTTTILPPLPAFKIPAFSIPPLPALKLKAPKFVPSRFTIPGFTFPPLPSKSVPKEIKN